MPRVSFDEELCKGCEMCVNACPKNIIELDMGKMNNKGYHPAHITNAKECIGCAACAVMCPDVVITVEV